MLGCAHACVRARAASRWASAELGTHPEFCPVEALCRPLVLAGEGARSSDRRSKAAIENWGKTVADGRISDPNRIANLYANIRRAICTRPTTCGSSSDRRTSIAVKTKPRWCDPVRLEHPPPRDVYALWLGRLRSPETRRKCPAGSMRAPQCLK
jgi:hypothetical protein